MVSVNIKNICKITFVIIGTIIGAGFASGQEIYTFFNKYGLEGLIGICISISLMAYIIYKTFKIIIENDINSYENFITIIMPERLRKNKILNHTINNIINIFLLICFNIMVAGFATYFVQELKISKWIEAIVITNLTLITLSNSINGVIHIHTNPPHSLPSLQAKVGYASHESESYQLVANIPIGKVYNKISSSYHKSKGYFKNQYD